MSGETLVVYLDQLEEAAQRADVFTGGMDEQAFLIDLRTQMAVAMAFVLIDEATSNIETHFPSFVTDHPDLPWTTITAMGAIHRQLHKTDPAAIWQMVKTGLPLLLAGITSIRHWHAQGE
jgi:uncharacterized protein with HEPN domain